MSRKGISQTLRQRLFSRCQGRCDYCGQRFGVTWDAHHRVQKSVGGKDHLANLVALHRLCHEKIHADATYEGGWLVESWVDPFTVPVRMFDGWRYLSDDGSMTSV